ncbi:MAG: hypothetical protein D6B26_05900 [Spirochaetaceae bacterium]|nr:MAG: hypothetical protein D6B26_05900 [Spirochaetaceae bacterium]
MRYDPPEAKMSDYARAIKETRQVRENLVKALIAGQGNEGLKQGYENLCRCLEYLHSLPSDPVIGSGVSGQYKKRIEISPGQALTVDMGYEISELQRDCQFLTEGWESLACNIRKTNYLAASEHEEAVAMALGVMKESGHQEWGSCITDRDGTINHYCGRYFASVQSVYNAFVMARFASVLTGGLMVLTSAPLRSPGLQDVNCLPSGYAVLAGSKGREWISMDGEYGSLPLEPGQQAVLQSLNASIQRLLVSEQWSVLTYIGSGVQFKHGQTAIARQDVHHSIPKELSQEFACQVQKIVKQCDPEGRYLYIEDTGFDLEIGLRFEEQNRAFSKGDGLEILLQRGLLILREGPHIVCGDTQADFPMFDFVNRRSPHVLTVLVSQDQDLCESARQQYPHVLCLSSPDSLIMLLNSIIVPTNM